MGRYRLAHRIKYIPTRAAPNNNKKTGGTCHARKNPGGSPVRTSRGNQQRNHRQADCSHGRGQHPLAAAMALRHYWVFNAEQVEGIGSPRLHFLLRREGLVQNHKRTERLYRAEGLSLRLKRRKKRPSHLRVVMPTPNGADESWAMDFVADALARGRRIRMLTIIDAWNRECPHIEVNFSLCPADFRFSIGHVEVGALDAAPASGLHELPFVFPLDFFFRCHDGT